MNTGAAVALWLGLVVLYFVPGIVASSRRVTNSVSVWVVNFFLGWTILGWAAALAMACRTSTRRKPSGGAS